jgi:FkbM family methyltransferase
MTVIRPRAVAKAGRDQLLRHSPALQRAIRALALRGHLPPSVWRRLRPIGVWTLHAPDGTPFRYGSDFADDRLAPHIVWTDLRHWECGTQPVLFNLARDAEMFVDIGAYSGIYTLIASAASPTLRTVACEPNPMKLAQLMSNVELNDLGRRVRIVGQALSSHAGRARLNRPSDDSQASLLPAPGGPPTANSVEVDVVTGDELLAGLPVDLIKIDVEGLEPEVLDGMPDLLQARRPTIIAECLDHAALSRLWETARRYGYQHAYHLDETGPVPLDEAFRHPYRSPNYAFTAKPW